MTMNYKRPGVYIEEVSTLPPSVAPVATAIPAFIGYTQKRTDEDGKSLETDEEGVVIQKIDTFLEYETYFGGPAEVFFEASQEENSSFSITRVDNGGDLAGILPDYLMYYSLKLYFNNGGGACYVISVGEYAGSIKSADLENGLEALANTDEPTLILMPDAVKLGGADYFNLAAIALQQCRERKDRFAILDLKDGDRDGSNFRNSVPSGSHLSYGAVYTPYLKTTLSYGRTLLDSAVSIKGADDDSENQTLAEIKDVKTKIYGEIKRLLAKERVILPPSAAVAGVYASVDRDRGVWKAPANVGLNSVIAPVYQLKNREQEGLNEDPEAGKSINAILSFPGRGVLVWGARTLAGNDNEWRYVNVRRLFNFIEESLLKATQFAVFEPNNSNTWLKVKGMTESFLYTLWQQGALLGTTPEEAYRVSVGLGKTMTPGDINAGRLIVEIAVAAVRPAEFIVLRFMHKLQEA